MKSIKKVIIATLCFVFLLCLIQKNMAQAQCSLTSPLFEVIIKPKPCTISPTPSVSSVTATSAYVSWDSVAGATGYKFEYKPANRVNWISQTLTSAGIGIAALFPNTDYCVRVTSFCSTTEMGSPSAITCFTTQPACVDNYEPNNAPSLAVPVAVPNVLNGTIDTPSDQDYFKFTTQRGETNLAIILANLPTNLSLVLLDNNNVILASSSNPFNQNEVIFYNSLTPATYKVQVLSAQGGYALDCYALAIIPSSSPYVTTPTALAQLMSKNILEMPIERVRQMIEPKQPTTLSLSPNPTSHAVVLSLDTDTTEDYMVYFINSLGQIVLREKVLFTEGGNTHSINTSTLPSGMYLVKVGQDSKFAPQKLLIEH